jgi:phosphomannomutase
LYVDFGCYKEHLISLTKKGIDGLAEINQMMVNLRENPVNEINGQRVICIDDYENSTSLNRMTNEIEPLTIPKSNVLIYYLEDGSKICARPSGTEPKIKFYFSVNAPLYQVEDFDEVATELDQKITNIIAAMHLN